MIENLDLNQIFNLLITLATAAVPIAVLIL